MDKRERRETACSTRGGRGAMSLFESAAQKATKQLGRSQPGRCRPEGDRSRGRSRLRFGCSNLRVGNVEIGFQIRVCSIPSGGRTYLDLVLYVLQAAPMSLDRGHSFRLQPTPSLFRFHEPAGPQTEAPQRAATRVIFPREPQGDFPSGKEARLYRVQTPLTLLRLHFRPQGCPFCFARLNDLCSRLKLTAVNFGDDLLFERDSTRIEVEPA